MHYMCGSSRKETGRSFSHLKLIREAMMGTDPLDRSGDREDNPYSPPTTEASQAVKAGLARCPACKNSLGYWTLVATPIPMRVICPYCKKVSYFQGITALAIVLILFAAVIGFTSDRLALYAFGTNDLSGMLMVMFMIFAPIHFTLAAYLRRYGNLL